MPYIHTYAEGHTHMPIHIHTHTHTHIEWLSEDDKAVLDPEAQSVLGAFFPTQHFSLVYYGPLKKSNSLV